MTISEIYTALNNNELEIVSNEIKKFNKAYRDGNPLISDKEYNKLIETFRFVDPNNELFKSGVIEVVEVNSNRKELLKYPMFSLDKESSIEEIHKWLINKGLPLSTVLVCTAKYDGISILKDEYNGLAWSRGDGIEGETVHEHYKKLGDKAKKVQIFTIGEMIIPKSVFASRTFYRESGEAFKNARNMIAGLKNSDTISDDLRYANHVRYGFASEDFTKNKSEQLDFISDNFGKVPYKIFRADRLNVEELNNLFSEWGKEYDIDGLVLDIDDKELRKSLGRERNNNPAYARAFKNPDWSEINEPAFVGIEWNLSKTKAIKPVVLLEPFNVEGVTISRVTGYNAKFIADNQIGEGSILRVIRSGGVIPKIIGVVKSGKLELPTTCPSCGSTLEWNENEVDLVCNNDDCCEISFKKLAFFFVRFNIEGFAEKTIKKFYDAGYDTVGKILSMSANDIQKLEGMGNLSATKILNEFENKIKSATFDVIGHASGCFENIGSRKLKMIVDGIKNTSDGVHFGTFKKAIENMDLASISHILSYLDFRREIVEKLNTIKGMSTKTSEAFVDGIVCFSNFMSELNIKISNEEKIKSEVIVNNDNNMKKIDLTGLIFVFTGIRMKNEEKFLIENGAQVGSSITKNTTHLVCKDIDSNSSKMIKAKSLGIKIISVEDFINMISE